MGAIVALATTSAIPTSERPRLIGETSHVELVATIDEPELFVPAAETHTAQPRVVIRPAEVEIEHRRFTPQSTDVSQARPWEIQRAQRLMQSSELPDKQTSPSDPQPPAPTAAIPSASPKRHVKPVDPYTLDSYASVPAAMHRSSPGADDRQLPELVYNPPPSYPLAAIQSRVEGTVVLRLLIGHDGRVSGVQVVTSSGHPVLDAEAVRAVRSWEFQPATRGGRPVAMAVRLPVRFELDRARG
jgi:protein TonB